MNVVDVQEQWIHTHFLLDRGSLDSAERTLVTEAIRPVLREHFIQADFHFVEQPAKGVTRLVLECVPLEGAREALRKRLAETIAPLPSGKGRNTVQAIRVEGNSP